MAKKGYDSAQLTATVQENLPPVQLENRKGRKKRKWSSLSRLLEGWKACPTRHFCPHAENLCALRVLCNRTGRNFTICGAVCRV